MSKWGAAAAHVAAGPEVAAAADAAAQAAARGAAEAAQAAEHARRKDADHSHHDQGRTEEGGSFTLDKLSFCPANMTRYFCVHNSFLTRLLDQEQSNSAGSNPESRVGEDTYLRYDTSLCWYGGRFRGKDTI